MSAALIKLKVDTIRHPEAFYHDLRLWQPPTRPKSKSKYMNVPTGLNPDSSLGLMLYDVFDLDIGSDYKSGKIEARPQISFFPASLHQGHLVEEGHDTLPTWETMKTQLIGGAK